MDLRMRGRLFPSRQALLFLTAIGVPCILLVGLSLRIVAQERELAEKRLADDRRRVATDVRQELLSRLERLRLEALKGGTTATFNTHGQRPVALVARVENDRLFLPWDHSSVAGAIAPAPGEWRFTDAVRLGEREELADGNFAAAVASYRRAVSEARRPAQIALAELLLARAHAKGGHPGEAHALYRNLLRVPGSIVDDQGIPFALYAARRLRVPSTLGGSDQRAVIEVLRSTLGEANLPPAAVYMIRDLARDLTSRAVDEAVRQAARELEGAPAIVDIEVALALQNAFPTLLTKSTPGSGLEVEPTWLPFGEPARQWLVNVAQVADGQMIVAVRAARMLSSLETVRAASAAQDGNRLVEIAVTSRGEPLGPNFPGLALAFEVSDAAGAGTLQRSFYMAALGLVVSITLFGAYLFWRDVRRDVHLAEMRSQFVSSVSHELKTPLTAIRMFAETLLIGRPIREDVREEYLETIVSESERLTRLLNNVLDFSKIEQGQKTYRLEPHSLGAIVRAAAKAMEYPLSQQGFELRVDIDDSLPPIAADPDAIEQAILNLLGNAVKYSGQGRVIDIQLTKDAGRAVISVTDRGLGIPLDQQTRIFDKFYRISGPDQERISGTGLGLTLVDHVVRAHGGQVTVSSAPGKGSTFSITLPLPETSAADTTAAKALA